MSSLFNIGKQQGCNDPLCHTVSFVSFVGRHTVSTLSKTTKIFPSLQIKEKQTEENNERDYVIPIIFLIIFIMGITANTTLISILVHQGRRNTADAYIGSLAAADLCVLITWIPFSLLIYIYGEWQWDPVICKSWEYCKDFSIGASVFTLAALSTKRFYAIAGSICLNMADLKLSTILKVAFIWILAMILAMPALFSETTSVPTVGNRTFLICNPYPEKLGDTYRRSILIFKFLAYYVIPLVVITIFNLRMKRYLSSSIRNMQSESSGEWIKMRKRVGEIAVLFIIIFVICFLPYHIYMLWYHFNSTAPEDNIYWHAFRIFGLCLSLFNSCINPIALRIFRQKFSQYICCCVTDGNRTESNVTHCKNITVQRSRRNEISVASIRRREMQEFNSTEV